jgi:hypothetical protein
LLPGQCGEGLRVVRCGGVLDEGGTHHVGLVGGEAQGDPVRDVGAASDGAPGVEGSVAEEVLEGAFRALVVLGDEGPDEGVVVTGYGFQVLFRGVGVLQERAEDEFVVDRDQREMRLARWVWVAMSQVIRAVRVFRRIVWGTVSGIGFAMSALGSSRMSAGRCMLRSLSPGRGSCSAVMYRPCVSWGRRPAVYRCGLVG